MQRLDALRVRLVLIVSHWPMVLTIAAALIEHEVLTYDEVYSLVELSA